MSLASKAWNFCILDAKEHVFQFVTANIMREAIQNMCVKVFPKDSQGNLIFEETKESCGFHLVGSQNIMNVDSVADYTLHAEKGGDLIEIKNN